MSLNKLRQYAAGNETAGNASDQAEPETEPQQAATDQLDELTQSILDLSSETEPLHGQPQSKFCQYWKGRLDDYTLEEVTQAYEDVEQFVSELKNEFNFDNQAKIALFVRRLKLNREAAEKETPEQPTDTQLKPLSKLKQATQSGALTSIGTRFMLISDPDLMGALSVNLIRQNGLFTYRKDEKGNNIERAEFEINNIGFLYSLVNAVWLTYRQNGGITGEPTQIYFPQIVKELGLDINHATAKAKKGVSRKEARTLYAHELMTQLDNIWGHFTGSSDELKLISIYSYDPETEVMRFTSPYVQAIVSTCIERQEYRKHQKKFRSWHCDLLWTTAASERNKASVEIASYILTRLQQRGVTPDAKLPQNKLIKGNITDKRIVTYKTSFRSVIEECSIIRTQLDRKKTAREKTKVLDSTLKIMYRILREKSDLMRAFKDVQYSEIIPTFTTLDTTVLIITHHGKDPTYKKPIMAIPTEATPDTPAPTEAAPDILSDPAPASTTD